MKTRRRELSGEYHVAEVKGRNVIFKGFEEFEFFYYRSPETDNYHIVEKSTGLSVSGVGRYYLKEARETALENLDRTGIEKFRALIAKQPKIEGVI